MIKNDDGGPAFPGADMMIAVHRNWKERFPEAAKEMEEILIKRPGLSLRDLFAGLALASGTRPPDRESPTNTYKLAVLCYEMADAMLKVRSDPSLFKGVEDGKKL